MHRVRPLPEILVDSYRQWEKTAFQADQERYRKLAREGQNPHAMVIACCDSRVNFTSVFGADTGEVFVHRNIANLVPPCEEGGSYHGTSAAVEYAVTVLKVAHLVVLGHSNCGGAAKCYDVCSGKEPEGDGGFVSNWIGLLRRGYDRLPEGGDEATRRELMEKQGVLVSLENLLTFPFVESAVAAKQLSLHGLWLDIAEGVLDTYDHDSGTFVRV